VLIISICFIRALYAIHFICNILKKEVKDLSLNDSTNKRFDNPLLSRCIRGLMVGKSECVKTTLLLNLLLRPGWLDFNNLRMFGKSLFQPEYRILKKAFEEKLPKEAIIRLYDSQDEVMRLNVSSAYVVEEMSKILTEKADMECEFFETAEDVPDPKHLNPQKNNLMIFDDSQLEKQNKYEAYCIRGRHSNINCVYLAQHYFKLPRLTIRDNANFMCLFPQDLTIRVTYENGVSVHS